MTLKVLQQEFSVCKVKDMSAVDFSDEFLFIGKTDEELSLVCSTDKVPDNAETTDCGWRAFRIEGILDFSMIGILSKISTVLAEQKIGIFAVSTYNTDYILTKGEQYEAALKALQDSGYEITGKE